MKEAGKNTTAKESHPGSMAIMPEWKVKVKICGITRWPDARCACEAGANFLGFNFYRRSPRYIEPAKAHAMVQRLPESVASVGIFVDARETDVVRTAQAVGLNYVQLQGRETPAKVSRLRRALPTVKIIKAIRVRKMLQLKELSRFADASAILLDGYDPLRPGGTGQAFDWSLAARANGRTRSRIFLAGGITAENVAEALRVVRPYAIDVCSGVESSPGKKDHAKIKALLRAVNAARPAARTR